MLRLCRSTSRRKASSSPPLAFATAAASSGCIWAVRRGRRERLGRGWSAAIGLRICMLFCVGCSGARRPGPWCARPAATWSASMTRSVTTAAAGIPASGVSRPPCAASGTTWASCPSSPASASSSTACTARVGHVGSGSSGRRAVRLSRARRASPVRCSARAGAVPSSTRALVDGPERRLASRRTLHILFNVLWIRQLAPAVGELYGPGRMVIIYTAARVVGFTLSSVTGLLPADSDSSGRRSTPWARRRRSSGCSARSSTTAAARVEHGQRPGVVSWAIMMFVFGLIMPASTTTRTPVDSPGLPGGPAAGSAQARTDRPHARRASAVWACRCCPSCLGHARRFW